MHAHPTSSRNSRKLSEGVVDALLRVRGWSDRPLGGIVLLLLLAIGEIMEDTARFNLPGVRLNEKARPTFYWRGIDM